MTGERDGEAAKPASRRYRWLIAAVVGVTVLWTAAWVWLSGEVGRRLDAQLAVLAARGQTVDCADRSIGGYPFRIEVRCGAVRFADRSGLEIRAAGARAVALVYRPTHAIVELDGPGRITLPTGEAGSGTWRLMQASLRFGSGRIERASLATDGFTGRSETPDAPPASVTAERFELHLRPDPDQSGIDLALAIRAGALEVAGRRVGPPAVDITADTEAVRLPQGAVRGGPVGFLRAWAAEDGRLDIRSLRLATSGLAVEGKGALALETDGLLTGMVRLTATGLEKIGTAVAKGGGLGQELAVMASGFLLFGKPAGPDPKAGRSIEFAIEQGQMKFGGRAIGRLPPLFPPASGS